MIAFLFESVGFGEWFMLLAVILIVVGPKRLPETARKFGQQYSKFRRAAENFKRQLLDMDTEITKATSDIEHSVEDFAKEVTEPTEEEIYGRAIPHPEEESEGGEAVNVDGQQEAAVSTKEA